MYKGYLISSVMLLLLMCADPSVREVKTWYDKDKEQLKEHYQVIAKADTSIRNGFYKAWYRNGSLKEEAEYLEGHPVNERRLYYQNDSLYILENYNKDGKFHGAYRSYHKNGNLKEQGKFEANNRIGVWKYFYPGGELKEEVRYKGVEEHGPFKGYYESGQVKAEGQYKNGEETGQWRFYYEDGSLHEVVTYLDGKEEGEVKVFTRDGELKKRIIYQGGRVKKYEEFDS